mmetsp:Transcript_295/g.1241  ORF Transcript_295/g.1241 Transcript_295/m.1241 type:complete len:153 (+) Transcript_295:1494-1952(+)
MARFDRQRRFVGCLEINATADRGRLSRVNAADRHSVHCMLPADYNFFVDYKSVQELVQRLTTEGPRPAYPKNLPLVQRLRVTVRQLRAQGSLVGRPKIVHWPGVLRKPWQRLHPRARSDWDEAWWRTHGRMCRRSLAPCRLACEFGSPEGVG